MSWRHRPIFTVKKYEKCDYSSNDKFVKIKPTDDFANLLGFVLTTEGPMMRYKNERPFWIFKFYLTNGEEVVKCIAKKSAACRLGDQITDGTIVHLHKVWPKHIRYPDHEKTSTVNYELSVAKEDVRLVGKDFLAFPPIIREEDIEPKKIEIKTFLF